MPVSLKNSYLVQYKNDPEVYFIIIKADKKFLQLLNKAGFITLESKKYKYWLVEYVFPFWKWCKLLRLPKNARIPRLPISQGLAILISWKLIEQNWKLHEIEYYDSDLDEVKEVEDLIDENNFAKAIMKIYNDNVLFSNIKSITLMKNNKRIAIDTLHSLIKIFDARREITKENYLELLEAINSALSRMIH